MYPAGPSPPYTPRTRKYILDNFSPEGLHMLVVDDDPLCLMVLERMLRKCNYKVTTCNRVSHALELLREEDKDFDLVISDVYMPDEDGFKLLEVIGLELDLPVIMISSNGDFSVVMKGIIHGACDYLIKPVRIEELRNIWQHVIRRKGKDFCRSDLQGENDVDARASESQEELYRKRKEILEVPDVDIDDISSSSKKARVNWSVQLHHQFVNAVNQLGVDKAVPKRILEIMNVQGLSRENIASHLQKYRLYLKRLSGVIPEPCPVASFQASDDGTPGGSMLIKPGRKGSEPVSSVKGLNLGAGLGSKVGKAQKVDIGTIKSLSQLKSMKQKQAANRAQVLSAIGVGEPPCSASSSRGGLFRMASLDLSFLLQAAHQQKEEAISPAAQRVKVVDDLAMCNINRSIKLENDVALPAPVPGENMYDLRKQSTREGPIAHSSIARGDKQGSTSTSAINIGVDKLQLHHCGSASVEADKLSSGYTGPVYMRGLSEEAMKFQGDSMLPNPKQFHSVDYDFTYGLFSTPDLQTLQADMTLSSSGKPSKPDYGQDKLQPIQEVTKEVVDESTDDTSCTKRTFELSAGSTATEMSFSNRCFDSLIEDLGIVPHNEQYSVQQTNYELLDVDEYLQLE